MMKLTPYTAAPPIAEHSSAGSLIELLSPGETGEIDRRHALQWMAGIGVGAAAAATIWDTAQPKLTTEVEAEAFVPENATRATSELLSRKLDAASAKSSGLLQKHEALFVRRVDVQWSEDHPCKTGEVCTTDANGNKSCIDVMGTCTETERASKTLVIDSLIDPVRLDTLRRHAEFLTKMAAIARELNGSNLQKIEGLVEGLHVEEMTDEEFARHFGFTWKEGQASTTDQTLIAVGFGLPASGVFLFYKQIWEKLKTLMDQLTSRSRYRSYRAPRLTQHEQPDQLQQEASQKTRRAFLQLVCGIGASTLALGGREKYATRSREIQGEGVQSIRGAIAEKNSLNIKQLFLEVFGTNPETILNEIGSQIEELRSLTQDKVEAAVRQGLKDLDAAEKQLYADMPFGAYGKQTTHKDDEYDEKKIRDYVEFAQTAADTLEQSLVALESVFKVTRNESGGIIDSKIPDELLPVLKAVQVTKAVSAAVGEQNSRHHWGLARDIGIMYSVAWGGMLLSEVDGKHHQAIYNVVHGFFDWFDRGKMSAYEVIGTMKKQYLRSQYEDLYTSDELRKIVTDNIELLKRAAQGLESIAVVHNPVVENYLRNKDEEKRRSLREQLEGLDINDVMTVYIDKAFAFFAKRQLSIKGLQEAISANRDYKDAIVKNPPFAEFKAKVMELIRDAGPTFVFDLIAQGVIDDNEPEEDWITAESHELNGYINYWANRVAGAVASTTNLYVALNILPRSWWRGNQASSAESLTYDDILSAFKSYIESKVLGEGNSAKIRKEIEASQRTSSSDRSLGTREIAERVLLRELKNAIEAAREWEILTEYSPKLKAAIAQPG